MIFTKTEALDGDGEDEEIPEGEDPFSVVVI
jgi:hypothetical protein